MKANRLMFTLLLLSVAVFQLAGQQTEPDRKQVEEVKAKAETGDAKAEYDLGLCYANGNNVAKDEVEAVKWFRKAAEQNYAKAQATLGFCYYDGQGVTKDEVEAVKWFRKAAEQNIAVAQGMLAACYDKGTGVTKDQVEAAKWSRKAAEQNDDVAQASRLLLCHGPGRSEGLREGLQVARAGGGAGPCGCKEQYE